MILKHDLKGRRYSSIHLNNLCKRTGCKYFEQEGQMYLYLKQEGQNVVEDSGTEVERRPLVPKVPGSNPVMSGFCLCSN